MGALATIVKAVVESGGGTKYDNKSKLARIRMLTDNLLSELATISEADFNRATAPLFSVPVLWAAESAFKLHIEWPADVEESLLPQATLMAFLDRLDDVKLQGNARQYAARLLQLLLPFFFTKVGNIAPALTRLLAMRDHFVVKFGESQDYPIGANGSQTVSFACNGGRGFFVGQHRLSRRWTLILTYNQHAEIAQMSATNRQALQAIQAEYDYTGIV